MLGNGQGLQQSSGFGIGSLVALAGIAIFYEIAEFLLHLRPIKNRPDTLEALVIPLVSAVVKFCDDGCCNGGCELKVNPIFEVNESCPYLPRALDVLLLDFLRQFYKIRFALDFLLDGFDPTRDR
jgi:hypothetical protein